MEVWMSNLGNEASSMRSNAGTQMPPDVQIVLDTLDRQFALECEAVLVGWQGPSPARAQLIDQVEARYRKHRASIMRRLADPFGR
jgi:hypothetical protein